MAFALLQLWHLERVLEDWNTDWETFVRKDVPKIVLVLAVAIVLARLLKLVTGKLATFSRREKLPTALRAQQLRTLAGILNSVGIAVIVFLAAMQILPLLGINMGPLLASAGVAGLAIGFGAQTLVHDVINGFFILMENQYDIGDVVRIGGVSGVVESMTLRRTVLRDDTGAVHTVPNSEIKIVSNLTRDWAQVALHISVDYRENSDRILELLKQVGNEVRNDPNYAALLVADPEVPGIERVSGGEVDYLMLIKTRPGQQDAVTRELRRRIKECFQQNNVQPGNPNRVYVMDGPPGTPSK
ncbi:MAG: mechanosensitive ion channel family protein [Terriglobales bacterium]